MPNDNGETVGISAKNRWESDFGFLRAPRPDNNPSHAPLAASRSMDGTFCIRINSLLQGASAPCFDKADSGFSRGEEGKFSSSARRPFATAPIMTPR